MKKIIFLSLLLLVSTGSFATTPHIFDHVTDKSLDETYDALYSVLEENNFWVVFEANMGKRLEQVREKWGENYNINKVTGIRSMVFCHIDWTHRLANADPKGLAVCPLHVTLYSQADKTHILMPSLEQMASETQAKEEATQLQNTINGLIKEAIQ